MIPNRRRRLAAVSLHRRVALPPTHCSPMPRGSTGRTTLAAKPAGQRARASLDATFNRLAVSAQHHAVLRDTFGVLTRMHEQGRDHSWAYYFLNLVRPVWLSRGFLALAAHTTPSNPGRITGPEMPRRWGSRRGKVPGDPAQWASVVVITGDGPARGLAQRKRLLRTGRPQPRASPGSPRWSSAPRRRWCQSHARRARRRPALPCPGPPRRR